MSPTKVVMDGDALRIGTFAVSFQRTLRIPDDGTTYPLPPGLGRFPLRRVADYGDRVPEAWRERGGVFLPMYQREAMWLSFHAPYDRPVAVQVGVGKVDALTGEAWRETLADDPQNYVVCPEQPWLDGIHAGEGFIRQFVAMPLGSGYTVESQVTGEEAVGGLRLRVVAPRVDWSPPRPETVIACYEMAEPDMGLAAGGRMRQKVYPDPYGLDVWDEARSGRVFVHIANSEAWWETTGEAPPPTPVSAATYTAAGLPWFDLYDDEKADLAPSAVLGGVASIAAIDAEKGAPPDPENGPLAVPAGQVKKLGAVEVEDGPW